MFDLIIRNGVVYDGTGASGISADIGINGDAISAVGDLSAADGEVLDAGGLAVSPGFIDLHTHSDNSFLVDPLADSKVRQGVTLELMGNCGMSYCSPINDKNREEWSDRTTRFDVDRKLAWDDFAAWLNALSESGATLNLAAQVGHGTVRSAVVGMDARAPSVEELLAMRRMVAEAIDAGALGFSTGLYFAPGSYSLTDEVVELATEAAERGVLYSTHPRSESNDGCGLLVAITEAIEIGRRTGVRVQISHIKCNGTYVWGRAGQVLDLIEDARREGLDVAGDQYPYTISSAGLSGVLFPRWSQAGGRQATLARMEDDDLRARMRDGIEIGLVRYQGPEGVVVANYAPDSSLDGKTLGEIADGMGVDPREAALKLYEQGEASVVLHSMSDEDVDLITRAPYVSMGSDGSSLRTTGPLSSGVPHPRNYGASARYLARTVRERKIIGLAEGIHRMTGMPAERLQLSRRGRIAAGYFADIAIFDPGTVQDNATEPDPHQYATGVSHVLVNGAFAVRDGQPTGETPGRVLRSRDA
ncbi:MAG: D-aminoacylase [Chloroflexi bacterium]|nr:D-aminoacylase [Chloroflexota bacterium]